MFDEEAQYTMNPRCISFCVRETGSEDLIARVSELALEKLEGGAILNSEEDMLNAYRRHHERIHSLARDKTDREREPFVLETDIS